MILIENGDGDSLTMYYYDAVMLLRCWGSRPDCDWVSVRFDTLRQVRAECRYDKARQILYDTGDA